MHVGLTDSQGNLIEFNEHGLQFGTTEWSGCFELASIDALISDISDPSVRMPPGRSVSDCPIGNRSDDDYLTKNFTSLTLDDKGSTAEQYVRRANLQTKDRLTGFPATGSSLATSSNKKTTKIIIKTTKKTNETTNMSIDSAKKLSDCSPVDGSNFFGRPASERNKKSGDEPDDMWTSEAHGKTANWTESSACKARLIADYWDYTMQICQHDQLVKRKFNVETYDELENNCLSFVCFFFKLLDLEPCKELANKTAFCERLVKPRLSELFKIIEFDRSGSSGYLAIRNDFKPSAERRFYHA